MSTVVDEADLPETFGYRAKRVLLGKPLVNSAMLEEKLSKKAALGVLSSDCISSSAYGSEEMLLVLLPIFGLAGFHLLMPLTAVVLALLVLTTLSYREVVMIYTRAGGSYVVARENFGPKVAQIASVALLIDYVVTVAVQSAAGVAAIVSIDPHIQPSRSLMTAITVGVVLILAYGNLRGVREAGRAFAFPTYFFVAAAGLVVIIGLIREVIGDLPHETYSAAQAEQLIAVHDQGHAIFSAMAIFVLLKAFANGGASLTGLEAISNGVSAFKPPEGRNARTTLSVMSILLGCLVLGVSFLAWQTHATPFQSGTPTVISQVAQTAMGNSWFGHLGFIAVQLATALILITGANTPFTGFPFLASFIAEDSFLPRQLTRRGHRLAFSTGIMVLTTLAVALLIGVGAQVDSLIPFYAIGVFTGFTMAGLGMARYHHTHRVPGWQHKLAVNATSGVVSAVVVLIFAVVKFREGAWLVVVLFPLLWLVLMRLNRQYHDEARSLDVIARTGPDHTTHPEAPHYGRHTILVLVDRLDLAVLRALRYAGSIRPTDLRVVHVVVDDAAAAHLQHEWIDRGLNERYPLETVEAPDRRLERTISKVALDTVIHDRAEVTVLLPRRTFHRLSQRLLHDRTADRIAETVSRIPHVAATIVPFDTTLETAAIERIEQRQLEAAHRPALAGRPELQPLPSPPRHRENGIVAIGDAAWREKVTVEGRIKTVQLGTSMGRSLEVQIFDETGGVRLLFMGRTQIPGLRCGAVIRATGRVGEYRGHLAIANPIYELVST
ncbi:MAG TPA: amino acid permease [Jatrophihabitans sp.]|nr:amino acid permease [Jatrophihabitans sp.]